MKLNWDKAWLQLRALLLKAEGLFIKPTIKQRWDKITQHPDMLLKRQEMRKHRKLINRTKTQHKDICLAWCKEQNVNIEQYPEHSQNWLALQTCQYY